MLDEPVGTVADLGRPADFSSPRIAADGGNADGRNTSDQAIADQAVAPARDATPQPDATPTACDAPQLVKALAVINARRKAEHRSPLHCSLGLTAIAGSYAPQLCSGKKELDKRSLEGALGQLSLRQASWYFVSAENGAGALDRLAQRSEFLAEWAELWGLGHANCAGGETIWLGLVAELL